MFPALGHGGGSSPAGSECSPDVIATVAPAPPSDNLEPAQRFHPPPHLITCPARELQWTACPLRPASPEPRLAGPCIIITRQLPNPLLRLNSLARHSPWTHRRPAPAAAALLPCLTAVAHHQPAARLGTCSLSVPPHPSHLCPPPPHRQAGQAAPGLKAPPPHLHLAACPRPRRHAGFPTRTPSSCLSR